MKFLGTLIAPEFTSRLSSICFNRGFWDELSLCLQHHLITLGANGVLSPHPERTVQNRKRKAGFMGWPSKLGLWEQARHSPRGSQKWWGCWYWELQVDTGVITTGSRNKVPGYVSKMINLSLSHYGPSHTDWTPIETAQLYHPKFTEHLSCAGHCGVSTYDRRVSTSTGNQSRWGCQIRAVTIGKTIEGASTHLRVWALY